MKERLEQIEERLAHLQRALDDMSDVIAQQEKTIDRLVTRQEMLLRREAERQTEQTGGVVLGDERPPHY